MNYDSHKTIKKTKCLTYRMNHNIVRIVPKKKNIFICIFDNQFSINIA